LNHWVDLTSYIFSEKWLDVLPRNPGHRVLGKHSSVSKMNKKMRCNM
jgi:hypothetical protein